MIEISFKHSDGFEKVRCDKIAWDDQNRPTLMMASLVGSAMTIKAIIAAVRSGKSSTGIRYFATEIEMAPEGYVIATYRLPKFNQVHVVLVAKGQKLMFGDVRSQLSEFLLSPATNTPMLPEWRERVIDEILLKEGVSMLKCRGIDAYKVEFDDKFLDGVVTDLLLRKQIHIPCVQQI